MWANHCTRKSDYFDAPPSGLIDVLDDEDAERLCAIGYIDWFGSHTFPHSTRLEIERTGRAMEHLSL